MCYFSKRGFGQGIDESRVGVKEYIRRSFYVRERKFVLPLWSRGKIFVCNRCIRKTKKVGCCINLSKKRYFLQELQKCRRIANLFKRI